MCIDDLGDEFTLGFRHTGESRYLCPLTPLDAGRRRHDESRGKTVWRSEGYTFILCRRAYAKWTLRGEIEFLSAPVTWECRAR